MKKNILAVLAVCFIFIAQASAAEFSADMMTNVAGMKTSSKIYFKDYNSSRTEVMGMIFIYKGSVSYQIFPKKKQYVVMDTKDAEQNNPLAEADNFEEFIEMNHMNKVGTETVSGYKCDVYEGTMAMGNNMAPMAMKFWYSDKLGYPVKSEAQMPSPMTGKSTSTLENIEIGSQPDSLFEIPSGYTEAESMADAMGMGGFSMPSGEGASDTPSQEDMEKMMKMMQDMMGQQEE